MELNPAVFGFRSALPRCGPISPEEGSPKNDASNRCAVESWYVAFAEYAIARRLRSAPFGNCESSGYAPAGVVGTRLVRVSHDGSIAPKKNRRSLQMGPPTSTPASLTCVFSVLIVPLGDVVCVSSPSTFDGRA